ncbi:AAA family ATPase [Rhodoferax aquaticus]|nr:AAA family ATPase [Rhodoferax aquaticus]
MHISHLKIANYKSFFQPTEFEFGPGFNILLGANSSGKTSVLEAIALHELSDTPHLSTLNSNEPGHVPTEKSEVELTISVSTQELKSLAYPVSDVYLGVGNAPGHLYCNDFDLIRQRLSSTQQELSFKLQINSPVAARLQFRDWPATWRTFGTNTKFSAINLSDFSSFVVTNNAEELRQIWQKLPQKIYRFSSERNIKPICGHFANGELLPNSENLAYCINYLQSNNSNLFDQLNKLLHRVFPTIYWVAAPPNGNNQFELRVHSAPTHLNRGDLAVPINRVGTGIGNALAILYVALTAQTQRLILLEEPNSFLHPRALRELLSILAEVGSKHQFFITTHSSDVLRTVDATTVTLMEHDGQQTTVKQTVGKKLNELRAGLLDLGISLTDLHGCDKVLWVEGETEAAVFPLLLRKYFPEHAQGIATLPLHATGDLESKKISPKTIANIYSKLSSSSFLAPPMVAIALDRESRRKEQITQIEADCAGVVHFLPVTMLEDYFLHADAISAVLSTSLDREISTSTVAEALERLGKGLDCLLQPRNASSNAIHAAKLLNAVFREVGTLEYHKTSHGPQIVKWLLANASDRLDPLQVWLVQVIQIKT